MSSESIEVVSTAGDATRRRDHPILFVHGICHGAWCWQPNFAPYFADLGYDVHAISLRGHAGSVGRESLNRYGLDDYVDDIVGVASGLPVPPIIIGHSMGGGLAQLVAGRHPQVLAAAVFLTPMVPGGFKVRELARTAKRGSLWSFIRLMSGRPMNPKQANALPFFDRRLDDTAAVLAAEKLHRESRRAIADLLRFSPPRGRLQVPVLVLGSSEDSIFGTAALNRTAEHYDADLVVLDTGCHDMMLDPEWRTSADAITSWLEGL